jgi:hypothetical protein
MAGHIMARSKDNKKRRKGHRAFLLLKARLPAKFKLIEPICAHGPVTVPPLVEAGFPFVCCPLA